MTIRKNALDEKEALNIGAIVANDLLHYPGIEVTQRHLNTPLPGVFDVVDRAGRHHIRVSFLSITSLFAFRCRLGVVSVTLRMQTITLVPVRERMEDGPSFSDIGIEDRHVTAAVVVRLKGVGER
jgi:hypothetical protein